MGFWGCVYSYLFIFEEEGRKKEKIMRVRGRNQREECVGLNNFHKTPIKRERRNEAVSEITVVHGMKVQGKGTSWNGVRKRIHW